MSKYAQAREGYDQAHAMQGSVDVDSVLTDLAIIWLRAENGGESSHLDDIAARTHMPHVNWVELLKTKEFKHILYTIDKGQREKRIPAGVLAYHHQLFQENFRGGSAIPPTQPESTSTNKNFRLIIAFILGTAVGAGINHAINASTPTTLTQPNR